MLSIPNGIFIRITFELNLVTPLLDASSNRRNLIQLSSPHLSFRSL